MHLIHQTVNGKITQSDSESCYYLSFHGVSYKMNVCSFIAFKTKLDAYNVEEMLLSETEEQDLEIIPLCNKEHFLLLNLIEIIEMRDLIQGALVMLELNSIVHHRIRRATLI